MESTFLGRVYRDGEVICRQGELADCMYVIQEGHVEVLLRRGEHEFCMAVLQAGDFFGEAALLDQATRLGTARAIGHTSVLSIERRIFFQRIHEDASFAMKIIRKMSRRIRRLEEMLISMGDAQLAEVAALQLAAGDMAKAAKLAP